MAAGGRPDEDELIARYFRPLAAGAGAFQLQDDAAVIPSRQGADLVVTKDALVAGVHFFPDDPPEAIARKALRVNLSDLAAKGARPEGYLLSLALPEDWTEPWLRAFSAGLADDQRAYGITLLGGDTVRTPGPVTISITAFGLVPEGRMVRRATAQPGHRIYVSGSIGDAALGLKLRRDPSRAEAWRLTAPERRHLLERYLLPEPRTALALTVCELAAAAMDVSDGLLGDLARLCHASGVGAALEVSDVPMSSGAEKALGADFDAMKMVLAGGDDYEILAIVTPENAALFEARAKKAGVAVRSIGEIVEGFPGRIRITHDGRVINMPAEMYRHF